MSCNDINRRLIRIQIQHLLKLNTEFNPITCNLYTIQIQHLLKLNQRT